MLIIIFSVSSNWGPVWTWGKSVSEVISVQMEKVQEGRILQKNLGSAHDVTELKNWDLFVSPNQNRCKFYIEFLLGDSFFCLEVYNISFECVLCLWETRFFCRSYWIGIVSWRKLQRKGWRENIQIVPISMGKTTKLWLLIVWLMWTCFKVEMDFFKVFFWWLLLHLTQYHIT